MSKMSKRYEKLADGLEKLLLILVGMLIVGVFIGLINAAKMLVSVYTVDPGGAYENFTVFLSYVLILVVGIEFVLMLITPSLEKTLNLVVYVVTRKMLIYGTSMLDMFLGSLAIFLVFATIKVIVPFTFRKSLTSKD